MQGSYSALFESMPNCPVKDLAKAINATLETNQPGISLAAALAFFATVRSRVTYLDCLQLEPRRVHANEFFCILARSGCGKSTAMELIENLLTELGLDCFRMNQPASGVALREQLAGTQRLFCWDEFGEAFAQAAAGATSINADVVRESKIFWGRNTNIKGKGYAKSAERAPIDIAEAYYTWLTATTANRIKEALSGEFVLDGFVPRFIFIEGEETLVFKNQTRFSCPQSVRDIISELYPIIKSDGDIASVVPARNPFPDPVQVVFEPAALKESLYFKAHWQDKREIYKDDIDDALSNKRLAHYLKLCLIIAPGSTVPLATAKWVHSFVNFVMDRQQQICESEIGRGKVAALKERILQAIPENDWISKSELWTKAVHNVEGKLREAALLDLAAESKVFCLKLPTGKPGVVPTKITRSSVLYDSVAESQSSTNNSNYQ
jgi:energy-coupling factor transporter ATP-binding protein EcfA2